MTGRALRRMAGGLGAALGCAGLLGGAFGVTFLKSVVGGFVSMAPGTGTCLALLGAALWLSEETATRRRLLAGGACAWAALALCLLVLIRYSLNSDLGLDRVLGRMAPATAISLAALGGAILLARRGRDADWIAAHLLAGGAAWLGLLAMTAYFYGSRMDVGFDFMERMALHTAGAVVILAAGILGGWPGRGLMAVFGPDRIGRYLGLQVLPVGAILPILFGWVYLRGLEANFFESAFGAAFVVLLFVAVLAAFIVVTATFLNKLESRRAVENRRYRGILASSLEGYCAVDSTGRFLEVNDAYCRMIGYSREELLSMSLREVVQAESPEEIAAHMERIRSSGGETFEARHRRKSGDVLNAEVSVRAEEASGTLIGFIRDIGERKRAEAELERLRTAIEQAGESIFITDAEGTIQFVNPAFEASTGYDRWEALGKNPRMLKSGSHDEAFYRELWATISSGRTWRGRLVNRRKDGSLMTEEAAISPVKDVKGKITNYVAVKRDISENIRLENELRQSQKIESIGRLAGGVAHDFNNILTAINGFTNFAMAGLREDDQRRQDLEEVLAAGDRATRLTGQLLAFSRRQILNPRVLDINLIVGETTNMLKRLIGEDIDLETCLAEYPCQVKVDAGQLEQVFLNLAINARDAMPDGGMLSFETRRASPGDGLFSRHPGVAPKGSMVVLTIRDTGHGMDEEVKAHLFEPFFTTKEKGKGTGLGLSMVYGIVKQSGGDIEVESKPGRGTTFHICFPEVAPTPPGQEEEADNNILSRGRETILLVDDEGPLRRFAEKALALHGYAVLTAKDGKSALETLKSHGRAVDLLITDVVMPGMNGRELAEAVVSRKATRKVLFMSGYAGDAIARSGLLEPGLSFLPKPFSAKELLRKARETLDRSV